MEAVNHVKTDSIEPCKKRKWSVPETNSGVVVNKETCNNVSEESSTLESPLNGTFETAVERTDDLDKTSLVKKKIKCSDQNCENPTPEDGDSINHKGEEGTLNVSNQTTGVSTSGQLDARSSEEKDVVSDLSEMKNTAVTINGKENILVSLDVGQTRHVNKPLDVAKNFLSQTLCSLPIGAPVSPLKKKLIILDINGLLADIVYRPPMEYVPDEFIAGRAVFKRPFCSDFLKFCFERFEVGVWSSRTKRNVDRLVDYLLGDFTSKLLFCWDQSQCTVTGFSTLENKNKSMIFKELRKIWEKQEPNLTWETGYYNKSNTLLLDDTPYKALLNPPHTAVFPYSYKFKDKNDNLLAEGGDLWVYLERFYMAEDVHKYVEQHPFGQIAITEQSASWPYYHQIVSYMSNASFSIGHSNPVSQLQSRAS
jgi:hypothetical protein